MSDRTLRFETTKRARTPTVLQMEAVECGAAALASVLGYFGRIVPLAELRAACGVSRDGTKASNVLKAARTYGLKGKGFSKSAEALPRLPLPAIVFWNFNHFLVVEGFERDRVHLNDPALGPRTVTAEEFDAAFTGVVLVFEPAEDFQPGGHRPSLRGALRERLRGSEPGLAYVVLASLALTLLGMVVPVFSKVFVDSVVVGGREDWLAPLLGGMALVGALTAGVGRLQRRALLRLSTRLAVRSSYGFLRHVLHLPIGFFAQRYGGEIGSRMAINDRLAQLLSGELAVSLLNLGTIGLYLALMLWFDPLLAGIAVAFAALNFAALRSVSRRRRDVNVRLLQERGKLIGTAMSGLQAIETLKSTGGESDFFARWAGQTAKVTTARQKLAVQTQVVEAVPGTLSALSAVAILGLGAVRVMQGEMTVGTLVAFQGLMAAFMQPVNQLVSLGSSLQELDGELARLEDVLGNRIDPTLLRDEGNAAPAEVPKLVGGLELRQVAFGYSPLDPPLIEDFDLTLAPGSRVALVGSSASGKSTLAKVVAGLNRPWRGEVLLDGRPRDEWPRSTVSNSVAMVDQDFFLPEGTVREVLSMWDATVPESEIVRAAEDACIHDEIAARAGGYDSRVEEGGRNFSHGQRQRLEIARALVGRPSLLVLDEATSALDPVTEKIIDENLRRRGCTCVIVAHRLSTIRDCDEIVVLDGGRVVQRGPHDELVAVRGTYRDLVAVQD